MPVMNWDRVADRTYETGLDRGVLYLPNGSAVPWNGLTSVVEKPEFDTTPIYFDGMKVNELITVGGFSATLSAVTYPDEFTELQGYAEYRQGMLLGEQAPQAFGLCYRTRVGDALAGSETHYKLHIIYNIFAITSDVTYASLGDDPSLVEFQWDLVAVPEDIPGFHPTSHIIIDSSKFDPWLLEDLEKHLYGSNETEASLMPMLDLVDFINEWYRVKIVDNGDGTWTATSDRPGFIHFLDSTNEYFKIINVNARYIDEDTYEISDTKDVADVPQIQLVDNGNGTWTAMTSHDNVIVMLDENTFEIRNVHAIFQSDEMYRITDTTLTDSL